MRLLSGDPILLRMLFPKRDATWSAIVQADKIERSE